MNGDGRFILEVRGLTKHFGGIRAIEDVSFRVARGSIISIIGPNGAGKTTLFNCLTGIIMPAKGTIRFSDTDITGLRPHEIVEIGIARTFQNIRLFRQMTALDNVLVARHRKIGTGFLETLIGAKTFFAKERASRERALEYLDFVGLRGRANVISLNLPYGEQKRLEIARALAAEPALLLLDEPTAGMNPQETGEIMELIRRLRELGKTVVLIEHDMKVVMGISESIIVLDHGVKISEGSPEMIRNDLKVIEAYLGRRG